VGLGRRVSSLALGLVALAASCGGNSFRNEGEAGSGEPGTGGANQTAGSASNTGGTTSTGGASPDAGTPGSGGTAPSAGAGGCLQQPCAAPYCPDGKIVEPECGCPYCSCENIDCSYEECTSGQVHVRPEGACCEICVPSDGCEAVSCEPESECPAGRTWQKPRGACCGACLPSDGSFGCARVACDPNLECPPGYVLGDGLVTGCCYECVPDPLYCVRDDECILAVDVLACCPCPTVINFRMYNSDGKECWFAEDVWWLPPAQCVPPDCDMECGSCPDPGEPRCVDQHCESSGGL
jgi:hypothetical protein